MADIFAAKATVDAACELVDRYDLPVFPCREKDLIVDGKVKATAKSPLTHHGFKDASKDLGGVRYWFGIEFPHALIGVPTGATTRLLVVDIDPKGAEWLRENAGRMACERIHKTQRGHHYVYRMPSTEIGCSKDHFAEGVDVRADGGYVIYWPSHGLEAIGCLEDVTLPPGWLMDLLTGPRISHVSRNEHGLITEGRNDFLSRKAFRMRKAGCSGEEILEGLRAANRVEFTIPLDDKEVRGIAERKVRNVQPASTEDRTLIQINGGQLHAYAGQAERLLADEIYVRGQELVRLGKAPELTPVGIQRDDEQVVVVPVGQEFLRRRLTERADFQVFRRREKEWVSVDCPRDLATNIACAGDWPEFRPLTGIATAPFLRPDHSLCDTPGYDASSHVFFAPNAEFPAIPRHPTKDQAATAAEDLLSPFSEFPFATEEARAAFASHLLTSAARYAIDVAPAFAYTAPLPGTGKSLLAGIPSRIEHGTPPAMRPFPDGDEELRKTLLGSLLAGDTTLILDNAPNGQRVRSPILCGFITASVYQDRRLGSSENPKLPNRCSVVMTGNNLTPSGDLARRCLIVRLDANTENVRGRDFQIRDIARYVIHHRPALLTAAITIIRAYAAAGYPDMGRPLPSKPGAGWHGIRCSGSGTPMPRTPKSKRLTTR